MSLALQRCFHHGFREAVARCPECRKYYCRECVTEFKDRVVCAACLRKLATAPLSRRPALLGAVRILQVTGGLLVAAVFFYWLGQSLLELPGSFHDGTLWQGHWLEDMP
jgi:hypothetical protein